MVRNSYLESTMPSNESKAMTTVRRLQCLQTLYMIIEPLLIKESIMLQ